MEMTVKDERKLVEIWLTNAEKSDPVLGIYNHMNFHLSSYCNFNLFPTESHAVFINCLDPGGSQFSIVFLLIDLLQCSFRRLLRICRDHPAVMS